MTEQEVLLIIEELMMPTNSVALQPLMQKWREQRYSLRPSADSNMLHLTLRSGEHFTITTWRDTPHE